MQNNNSTNGGNPMANAIWTYFQDRKKDWNNAFIGLYHQFECLEDGIAYELYWAEFNHDDIERESTGYMEEK